jgi:hypothetical protein
MLSVVFLLSLLTLLQLAEIDVELHALKALVENVVAFFYPGESSTIVWAPQMLDSVLTRSLEVILANMKYSTSLNLWILKFLYPWANLDVVGEGFAATCTDEEASKLVEDSAMMAECIIEMLLVDMS